MTAGRGGGLHADDQKADDYIRGDEAKWKKTFLVGNSAVFIDDVEKEDGLNIAQTSLTVARDNGYPLGAVTIGINVDALK